MTVIPHWMQYIFFAYAEMYALAEKKTESSKKIRQPTLFDISSLILAYFFFPRFSSPVMVLYYFLPFNRHHMPALVCQRDGSWVIHQRDTAQQNNPWVYCILIRAKKRDTSSFSYIYCKSCIIILLPGSGKSWKKFMKLQLSKCGKAVVKVEDYCFNCSGEKISFTWRSTGIRTHKVPFPKATHPQWEKFE